MTGRLLPLDAVQHRNHGWRRHTDLRFAAGDAWAPLLLAELPAALPTFPLAFVQRPGGGWQLAVVQGLHAGDNLCLDAAGRWVVGYLPSYYRGHPFVLCEVALNEGRRKVLCFDLDSGLYRETPRPEAGEERFFDDDGKLQPLPERAVAFLQQTDDNRQLTHSAVDALAEAELLQPWELAVPNPDADRPLLSGLMRIDEARLNTLDAAALAHLRSRNGLSIAYAQVFSLPRLGLLRRLYERRAARSRLGAGLDGLLAEDPADSLNFDFDSDSET